MTERLTMLSDMMTCILGTAFFLWIYIKSLKENTIDGMTNTSGFFLSLAKYGLVVPFIALLALLAATLSIFGVGLLASLIFH